MLDINKAIVENLDVIEQTVTNEVATRDHRVWGMREDLMQDAILHLMEYSLHKAHCRSDNSISAFIRRTVRNRVRDTLRSAYERKSDWGSDELLAGPSAYSAIERADMSAKLEAAIASLEASDRLIADMLMAGMVKSEIAKAMNLSPATITRRSKAIAAKLHEKLG